MAFLPSSVLGKKTHVFSKRNVIMPVLTTFHMVKTGTITENPDNISCSLKHYPFIQFFPVQTAVITST